MLVGPKEIEAGDLNPHSPNDAVILSALAKIVVLDSTSWTRSSRVLMTNPAGESTGEALRLDFDRRLLR